MTIKKRLVVSNILMILVPVFITIAIAAASIGIIWFTVAKRCHGDGSIDTQD